MKGNVARTGLRLTTILVSMVVGMAAVILCCCIFLFLNRYRSAYPRKEASPWQFQQT